MTIRIPLRVLLFVLYTVAVLAGAFGISYAVFEWRDDSPDEAEASEIEGRVDSLSDRIGNLSTEVSAVSDHSHDDCGVKIAPYVEQWVNTRLLMERVPNPSESEIDAAIHEVTVRMLEMQQACR